MLVAILCLSHGHGGLELYAVREHKELAARGIDCLSIVAKDSMLATLLQEQGFKPDYLDVKNRRLPLIAAKQLARLLDQHGVDVLHMHWNKDLNLAVLAKVFAKRNIKLVYSRHMDITRSKKDLFHRWFYNRLDLLLTNSKLVTRDCNKFLPLASDKIRLLYLGVPAPTSTKADCQLFFSDSFPRRRLNLACFGRIEPYKAQHTLVEAARQLLSERLDISVTIVGHTMDPVYANNLKQDVERNQLSPHIQFLDFVKNPIEVMSCFEVVVLTTMQETFGLVLAEAMRAGVAVIGTNAGGVPDIIEHDVSGLLTDPGSPESLTDAIKQLYDDPEKLDRLSNLGQARANQYFSDEIHFNELKSLLLELCS